MPDLDAGPPQGRKQTARARFFLTIAVVLGAFVLLMMILLFIAD